MYDRNSSYQNSFYCKSLDIDDADSPEVSLQKDMIKLRCLQIICVDKRSDFANRQISDALISIGVHLRFTDSRTPWVNPVVVRFKE